MDDVVKTETRNGRVKCLPNGNVSINGVEVEPPPGWWPRWSMHDAAGNLILGSTRPGTPPLLILRNPTMEEVRREIGRRMAELQAGGVGAHAALDQACRELPRHAEAYRAC